VTEWRPCTICKDGGILDQLTIPVRIKRPMWRKRSDTMPEPHYRAEQRRITCPLCLGLRFVWHWKKEAFGG
jgi:hypothetical protein